MSGFGDVFLVPKPIIAMIHVWDVSREEKIGQAIQDLERLQPYVDAVIVENYGWGYASSNKATTQAAREIELVTKIVVKWSQVPVGVNLLPNDYWGALRIASRVRAQFIQLDHVTGRFLGHDSVDPMDLGVARQSHPEVAILGGIHPKYYRLEDPTQDIGESAKTARDLCEAIVVTGEHTGGSADITDLRLAKQAVGEHLVIIGSGLTSGNAASQLTIADGAIVGSFFKRRGVRPGEMIDVGFVRELMEEVRKVRPQKAD